MKHHYRFLWLGSVAIALIASACARLPEDQPSAGEASPSNAASPELQEFAAFQVSWPRPKSEEVDSRATTVAEIMLAQQLPARPFSKQLSSAAAASVSFSAALGSATSKMSGRYRHGADELLLNNRELQRDNSSEPDIGEVGARTRFVDGMQQLADAGVIDGSLFDLNAAIVSQTKTVTGSDDSDVQVERIVSHDFLVRPSLNGIPFLNAGVRLSIHRSGAISGVRLGGAVVAATLKEGRLQPTAPGYVFRAKLDEKYYQARFAQEFPRAQVNSKGVLYMLPMSVDPEAGQKQVLEPEYVFNFANHYDEVVARRRYVGYSISNPTAPAHELSPAATPNITGDTKPSGRPLPVGPGGTVQE